MKKGVYIRYMELTAGAEKKILGQIKAFEDAGFQMSTICMDIKMVPGWKVLYRFPFINIRPYWRWFDEFGECDFIYFRHPHCMNLAFLKLMKRIKEKNQKVKIIMEIPTYPYDKEMLQYLRNFPAYLKDKVIRESHLERYIDAIAVLTPEDKVFGVKAIQIRNGFDFSNLRIREIRKDDEKINIVMCASMERAHGYERIITGLYKYYENGGMRNIILHFIGDGLELPYYRSLIHKYNLENKAIFYGMKDKNEIEKIYDKCDLGVSVLGGYKKGIEYHATLKTREYFAAGLPFIGAGSHDVSDYDEFREYVLSFSNDPTPIDMTKVVAFYDKLYGKKNYNEITEMAAQIRNMAEKRLNMRSAMQSVSDFINME